MSTVDMALHPFLSTKRFVEPHGLEAPERTRDYAPPASYYDRCGCVSHSAPRVRSSHVCGARPVSTSTIVMHPSTGHTSEHKLHPTHSVSSTRGMRARGVGYGPDAANAARSLRVTGVSAID